MEIIAEPAIVGVYPTNQTAWLLSIVPVLPAWGRRSAVRARPPVPRVITEESIELTASATSLLITRVQSASGASSSSPLVVVIVSTMTGLQWIPPEANVAYASAIDSGLTSTVPRVKDGLSS